MRLALALVVLTMAVPPTSSAWADSGAVVAPPVATRALLKGLRASGRAEAAVRLSRRDPVTGRASVLRGRLALELAGLARLDLEDGERLTLRPDGGDWLQPATRQLVRAGTRSAAGVLVWWTALVADRGGALRERPVGPGAYELVTAGTEEVAQRVELDARGLPRRLLVAVSPEERLEYHLSRWRFVRPRGRADFALEPPVGFELVELP